MQKDWLICFVGIDICLEYKNSVSEEAFEVPGASTSPHSNAASTARHTHQQKVGVCLEMFSI